MCLSSEFTRVFEEPHCCVHKWLWVWWAFSRLFTLERTLKEGVSSFSLLIWYVYVWRRLNLCANIFYRGNYLSTTLCFKREFTWVIKVDFVVQRSRMHKTLKVDFSVLQTWMHMDLQSWLHCASNMNSHGSAKLTSLCFEHECTWSGVCMCFNLEHTWSLEHIHATCCNWIIWWLVHALCQSWTACAYSMLWSNNNCLLRSCSHNYQLIIVAMLLQ